MTRQDVPPLLTLSGAVLEPQGDRVGLITLSDRCRRPVGREKKKKHRSLILGTRTIWKKRKNRDVSFLGHAPYGAIPKNETSLFFLFFSAHWPSATVR